MSTTWRGRLKNAMSTDGRRRLLVAVGLIGIGLLGLSEWLPRRQGIPSTQTETVTVTASQVEEALEKRIGAIIEAVEGVGTCRVMVTLESGTKTVYAADTASSTSADGQGGESKTSQETLLIVETADGPVGLPVMEVQPTVKGVAVVCQGGGDPAVCQQVIDLVSTAFHISDRRVYVAKQK